MSRGGHEMGGALAEFDVEVSRGGGLIQVWRTISAVSPFYR